MCCRKKIYRNLSGYFYRKLYIRSFPSRMFSMQWRISQRIYTRSGIYIFNLSGISSNLHSFPQSFFFLSIVWISTIKIHANSEGFAIRTDHIGTCSLHIPLISLYLFLLLFFLQLYAFSVYIYESHDSDLCLRFDISLCQIWEDFEEISYLAPILSSLSSVPPISLLPLGNREYFEITVCIKSSRTFNGRLYRKRELIFEAEKF